MEIDYTLVGVILLAFVILIIYLVIRNRKDEKKFEKDMSKSELRPEKHKETGFNCHAIVVRSEKSHVEDAFNIALTFIDVEEKDLKVLMKFLDDSYQKNKESSK